MKLLVGLGAILIVIMIFGLVTPENVILGLQNDVMMFNVAGPTGAKLTLLLSDPSGNFYGKGSFVCNGTPDTPGVCYPTYVGSAKDPWSVYNTVGKIQAGTSQILFSGQLTDKNGAGIDGIWIDVSWYYAVQQTGGGFQVQPLVRSKTTSGGYFNTVATVFPGQTANQQIIVFAEVEKGSLYDFWTCTPQSSTAECFTQSDHYLIGMNGFPPAYTVSFTDAKATQTVWAAGVEVLTEVQVDLPFTIQIHVLSGTTPTNIYMHVRQFPKDAPAPSGEEPGYPATMHNQGSGFFSFTVGDVAVGCKAAGTCDTEITNNMRYQFIWADSVTNPFILNILALAFLSVGPGTQPPSVLMPTISQGISIIVGIIGALIIIVDRKYVKD